VTGLEGGQDWRGDRIREGDRIRGWQDLRGDRIRGGDRIREGDRADKTRGG
jgi:hypothetical protein